MLVGSIGINFHGIFFVIKRDRKQIKARHNHQFFYIGEVFNKEIKSQIETSDMGNILGNGILITLLLKDGV